MDSGASLTKIALRDPDGTVRYRLEPAAAAESVAGIVEASGATHLGLTGAGAVRLAQRLVRGCIVSEFDAWGAGARALLGEPPAHPQHLLVSLGTGTSALRVDAAGVERVGGTALGGGTLLGLGAALVGCDGFEELAALAARGSRQRVDLLVSDLYPPGEIALPGEVTAANFGKLTHGGEAASREDLAHALMGMVGENIALICAGLAAAHRLPAIVYAGGTLRSNPALIAILGSLGQAFGSEVVFLEAGEFAGALGALLLAEASD